MEYRSIRNPEFAGEKSLHGRSLQRIVERPVAAVSIIGISRYHPGLPQITELPAIEEELVAAAKLGHHEAFIQLCDECSDLIRHNVFRILRNKQDSDDVIQDTLLKGYAHIANFRGGSKFSTWLSRIAINSALMLLRSRKMRTEVSCESDPATEHGWDFIDPLPNAEEIFARNEARDRVFCAVDNLPLAFRVVIHQFYCQDHSLKQISEISGISVSAIKSRLRRARILPRASVVPPTANLRSPLPAH